MLPVAYLVPCLSAVAQLVKHYGCTAVLCTATQPSLDKLLGQLLPEYPPRELCPIWKDVDFFERQYVRDEASDEDSPESLLMKSSALHRKQPEARTDTIPLARRDGPIIRLCNIVHCRFPRGKRGLKLQPGRVMCVHVKVASLAGSVD